ncbi:MAG TPA: hypothetical protein PK537_09715 [Candidatus Limiplasma sp.]|nr:hypothetical protein [Candidatus Limiplasma sp.]
MTDFITIINAHRLRYALMQPQDFGKLAYQSAMGPEHLITDEQAAIKRIEQEWQSAPDTDVPCNPEPIGNGLCRFHMTAANYRADAVATLARLFIRSAAEHVKRPEALQAYLRTLEGLPVEGMEAWLTAYRQNGCPPVRHSEEFRNAYHPHYRVVMLSLIHHE